MVELDLKADDDLARSRLETLEKQQQRRDEKPLYYCKLVSQHPLKAFFITLGLHLMMIIASGVLLAAGYDLLPVYMDDLPVNLRDLPWQPRVFAWLDKTSYAGYYNRAPSGGFRTQSAPIVNIDMYYEMEDKTNVFTKQNLQWIEALEGKVIQSPDYDKYCQLDLNTGSCFKPLSIIRYFDGTFAGVSPIFNDTNYDRIEEVLLEAATNPKTKTRFSFFLGTNSNVNGTYSWITRSTILFGTPIEEYIDDEIQHWKDLGDYQALNMEPVLEDHLTDETDNFKFSYRSQALWFYFATTQAVKDIFWAGASIAFIFCLMLFHTRSLWITAFAVFSVIASFVTTNLLYNLVMQFHYLGFFHVLSLFIILGIGADNFFVFYDVWRNTGCETYISVAHRLSDTYRKSAISMLFTSLTTSVAFFSNAISPLLATRAFGVFAGSVVIVNYLSAIIYFPTVVMMYHAYFEGFQWPCIRCCLRCCKHKSDSIEARNEAYAKTSTPNIYDQVQTPNSFNEKPKGFADNSTDANTVSNDNDMDIAKAQATIYQTDIRKTITENKEVVVIKHDFIDKKEAASSYTNKGFDVYKEHPYTSTHDSNGVTAGQEQNGGTSDLKEKRNEFTDLNGHFKVSKDGSDVENIANAYKGPSHIKRQKKPLMARFFRNYYFLFITNKYIRWVILVCMAGVLGFFIYQASKIKSDNELFAVLPSDHPYEVAMRHRLDSFVASYGDETLTLYVVWGLKANDMDNCQFSDPVCDGKLVIDNTFDPNPVENQLALKQFCETLQNMDEGRANLLRMRKNPETEKYEIRCFLQNMDDFLKTETSTSGTTLSFPYTKDAIVQFMRERPEFYNESALSSDFKHYLEIPLSYWLSSRYTNAVTDDFTNFDPLIGEEQGPHSLPLNSDSSKYYGNNIRYIAIEVNTTIKFRILGHEEGLPIRTEWEKLVTDELANMPDGLKNGFQTDSRFRWHWLSVQEMLIENAVYGIVIGVCLAFPILVIATGNIIVGALATFSLCCCTVCVIGVIPLGGWQLGALESLNMCMVVGLSVDYVVHLSQAYSSSLHRDRLSRVQDMLDEMATSVFFGAITTIGAAMFMFFTLLTFFTQFGVFLLSTIGFSLLFSMGMFTTLMGLIGPQNDVGNMKVIFQKCCGRRTN